MLLELLAITSGQIQKVAQPIIDISEAVIPVLLVVVGAIGGIWCIFLGVKYAKASDPQEHEKAKSGLKNAIIGFVLIFALLAACKIGVDIFTQWYQSYGA